MSELNKQGDDNLWVMLQIFSRAFIEYEILQAENILSNGRTTIRTFIVNFESSNPRKKSLCIILEHMDTDVVLTLTICCCLYIHEGEILTLKYTFAAKKYIKITIAARPDIAASEIYKDTEAESVTVASLSTTSSKLVIICFHQA